MQHLPLHPIIVPDALDGRIERITGLKVQAHDVVISEFVLKENRWTHWKANQH